MEEGSPNVSPVRLRQGKSYLSICEYLRKCGLHKTLNQYYSNIVSSHPTARSSPSGEEAADEVGSSMLDAAKEGNLGKLQFLCRRVQEDAIGTCIGERLASLMLHVAAECGHAKVVAYLVNEVWVDVDAETVRGMTALHYCTKANRLAVIRELAQLGADMGALNDNGQAPAQLSSDRVVRRLYQQYTGGGAASVFYLRDRSTVQASRVIDYIAVMTVLMRPPPEPTRQQTKASTQSSSDGTQDFTSALLRPLDVTVPELFRWPAGDFRDGPFPDANALVGVCAVGVSPPVPTAVGTAAAVSPETAANGAFATILTDEGGHRSYAAVKVLGCYRTAAQRGRAAAGTALAGGRSSAGGTGGAGAMAAAAAAEAAGDFTARIVVVLSQFPDMPLHQAVADDTAAAILKEAESWGGLSEWPLDFEQERMAPILERIEHLCVQLPLPLPSELVEHRFCGKLLRYGDPHAAHRHFPLVSDNCLAVLLRCLSPDNVLAVLAALLQEQSVLLLSEDVEDLGPAAEALCALLFPFSWPHTLVPTLPRALLHYAEAPVPFLMGLPLRDLPAVNADLSSILLANLSGNSVVTPIRPLPAGAWSMTRGGGGDGGSYGGCGAVLEELPRDAADRAVAAMDRAVPAAMAPLNGRGAAPRRKWGKGRAATPSLPARPRELYAPAVRVAVADMMVELIGNYQTLRYVEGARRRFLASALPEHQPFLSAMLSTQLWQLFREQCSGTDVGTGGRHSREAQVQLFTECVEFSRGGIAAAASTNDGGSRRGIGASAPASCGTVLYPSDDIEEVLASLTVLDLTEDAVGSGGGHSMRRVTLPNLADPFDPLSTGEASRGTAKGACAEKTSIGTFTSGKFVDRLKERLSAQASEVADMLQPSLSREGAPPADAVGGVSSSVFERAGSSWKAVRRKAAAALAAADDELQAAWGIPVNAASASASTCGRAVNCGGSAAHNSDETAQWTPLDKSDSPLIGFETPLDAAAVLAELLPVPLPVPVGSGSESAAGSGLRAEGRVGVTEPSVMALPGLNEWKSSSSNEGSMAPAGTPIEGSAGSPGVERATALARLRQQGHAEAARQAGGGRALRPVSSSRCSSSSGASDDSSSEGHGDSGSSSGSAADGDGGVGGSGRSRGQVQMPPPRRLGGVEDVDLEDEW